MKRGLASLVAVMVVAAACGGGGGDQKQDAVRKPGTDGEFVGAVCAAYRVFTGEVDAVLKRPDQLKTAQDVTEKLSPPVSKLATAFANANPPADIAGWHAQAAEELTATVERLKTGKLDAAAALGVNPIPAVPGEVAGRLNGVAANNTDCRASGFDFARE
ncbi:MAG: hypothetical protein IT302_10315 [Dehalococcoidia bacterium]|nr:hypothetical protein [Dehalococcoidia bacterium]